jgi:hypothetical protein
MVICWCDSSMDLKSRRFMVLYMERFFILIFLLLSEAIVCIISPLAKIMNNFVTAICAMQ